MTKKAQTKKMEWAFLLRRVSAIRIVLHSEHKV